MFLPRSWNQRYCREPDCLPLLHRWQADRRQRRLRLQVEKQQQHAEAERQRRGRRREQERTAVRKDSPTPPAPRNAATPRAWSRSAKIPHDFCDRPGCYGPLQGRRRGPTQYCGKGCSRAERRVQDRERKFKARKRKAALRRFSAGCKAASPACQQTHEDATQGRCVEVPGNSAKRVRRSRQGTAAVLSSRRVEALFILPISQGNFPQTRRRRPTDFDRRTTCGRTVSIRTAGR